MTDKIFDGEVITVTFNMIVIVMKDMTEDEMAIGIRIEIIDDEVN